MWKAAYLKGKTMLSHHYHYQRKCSKNHHGEWTPPVILLYHYPIIVSFNVAISASSTALSLCVRLSFCYANKAIWILGIRKERKRERERVKKNRKGVKTQWVFSSGACTGTSTLNMVKCYKKISQYSQWHLQVYALCTPWMLAYSSYIERFYISLLACHWVNL